MAEPVRGSQQQLVTPTKKNHLAVVCLFGVPKGIRTPVAAVKGQCPRPLDDGDLSDLMLLHLSGDLFTNQFIHLLK